MPNHYRKQYWAVINWTPGTKFFDYWFQIKEEFTNSFSKKYRVKLVSGINFLVIRMFSFYRNTPEFVITCYAPLHRDIILRDNNNKGDDRATCGAIIQWLWAPFVTAIINGSCKGCPQPLNGGITCNSIVSVIGIVLITAGIIIIHSCATSQSYNVYFTCAWVLFAFVIATFLFQYRQRNLARLWNDDTVIQMLIAV